jgi:formylmethanofuran dehydrogenase subunit C
MRLSLEFFLPGEPVDLGGILPETLLPLSKAQISRLLVTVAGQKVPLGGLCRVSTASRLPDALHLLGDTSSLEFIGSGMSSGHLVVAGDAGYGAGQKMRGGRLEIRGGAGERLGFHLQGGLILVGGNAGRELGCAMRGGVIYVKGDAAEFCASRMRAGTILCAGRVGKHAGAGMRRGSLVAGTMDGLLPGFREAGTADPGWLGICLAELVHLGIAVPPGWAGACPRRWTGDHLESGKGEILIHAEPQ